MATRRRWTKAHDFANEGQHLVPFIYVDAIRLEDQILVHDLHFFERQIELQFRKRTSHGAKDTFRKILPLSLMRSLYGAADLVSDRMEHCYSSDYHL